MANNGSHGRRSGPRPVPGPTSDGEQRRWPRRLAIALLPLIILLSALLNLWVDWLWFGELGQSRVLAARVGWATAIGAAAGLLALLVIGGNVLAVLRVGRNDLYVPFLVEPATPVGENVPRQIIVPQNVLRPLLLAATLILAFLFALGTSGRWETVLQFVNRVDFGIDDPKFGHDASLYVFTLPFVELIMSLLKTLIVLTMFIVGAAYVLMGVVRYAPVWRIAPGALMHLAALAAAWALLQAVSFALGVWELVFSETGVATGAGFTDVHARIPGMWVMAAVSVLVAGALLWGARSRSTRVLRTSAIVWVGAYIVTVMVVPSLVQRLIVEPTEIQRERPVIENNIRMTRIAYDLDDVQERDFASTLSLSPADIEANKTTIDNVRLWDPQTLLESLRQLQAIRPYYVFNDVDVDRYVIDGAYRQTMMAAREIQPGAVTGATWVNQRLQYTHGYGVAGAFVNEISGAGDPRLFIQDIPPESTTNIKVKQPAIYYGEQPDHYVLVKTKQKEFDYPEGGENREVVYAGKGGIEVGNPLRRAALALRLGDLRMLLSSDVTSESRVMIRRNVVQRVRRLAPFLQIDNDPYITIIEGRLVWVIDAYTTSARFPYSQHNRPLVEGDRINYVRNSVKTTIDAFDGTVTLYVVDDKDPLIRVWQRIYPSLFTKGSEMPKELVAHLRYPEELFELQSQMWATYHMDDPRVFYNKEDEWEVPTVDGQELDPFYVLTRLPGAEKEEMLLMRPMTPRSRQNMVAWMGVRMDPGTYGEMITYGLSKQRLTYGPAQVAARISQNDDISQQFTLWNSQDVSVIKGNLLVIPIEESLLYVQPIYLAAQETQQPELRRVIVALGNRVVWGSSLEDALDQLFEGAGPAAGDASGTDESDAGDGDGDGEDGAGQDGTGTDTGDGADSGAGDGDGAAGDDATGGSADGDGTGAPAAAAQQRLQQIAEHYDKALECQREGDWECYGREIDAMGDLLDQ